MCVDWTHVSCLETWRETTVNPSARVRCTVCGERFSTSTEISATTLRAVTSHLLKRVRGTLRTYVVALAVVPLVIVARNLVVAAAAQTGWMVLHGMGRFVGWATEVATWGVEYKEFLTRTTVGGILYPTVLFKISDVFNLNVEALITDANAVPTWISFMVIGIMVAIEILVLYELPFPIVVGLGATVLARAAMVDAWEIAREKTKVLVNRERS